MMPAAADPSLALETLSTSGLVLMFVLGLRHGLDPDHIACVDGLTWRALNRAQHRHAPWIGTLFAIGHGSSSPASRWRRASCRTR